MVHHGRISPEIRAFIKLDRTNSGKRLGIDLGVSLAQVYRIKKEPLRHVSRKKDTIKNVFCRPEILDERTKRHLIREVHNLRKREPNWTVKRLMEAADIKNVSRRTFSRFLNKNGYNYLRARRKGFMPDKDRRARVAFAKKVEGARTDLLDQQNCLVSRWASFAYKRHPKSQAQAPKSRVWRR